MIITIVSDVFGIENNGTTITMKRLINNLKERGHTIRVVSPLESNQEGYYTLPKRGFWIFNNYVAKNGIELAKPVRETLLAAFSGTDLVHVMLPFKAGQMAAKLANEMQIPVTAGFHCQPENFSTHIKMSNFKLFNKYLYRRFYKKCYQYVSDIHCPSEFIANQLRLNNYNNNLHVISNGVDDEYHQKKVTKPSHLKGKYCILFIGRLSGEKRHDLLIDAVKVSKYESRIQILFAGCGPKQKKLRKRGEKLTNPPMFGFYKQNDLVNLINTCDLYVHPSDIEIEAISCLEAISCGLVPIISNSKRSATNYFALHDENLFEAGNPFDLASKIDYFIENPDVVNQMRKEYLEYSERFAMKSCMDQMEQMFNQAFAKQKIDSEAEEVIEEISRVEEVDVQES